MTEYPSSTSSSDVLYDQYMEDLIRTADKNDVVEHEYDSGHVEYRLYHPDFDGAYCVLEPHEYYRIIWGIEDVNESYKPEF